MTRTNNLPIFFNYKEEKTDNGYESLQDFFMSWTIRCAVESNRNENPILNHYSSKIVYALLFGKTENSEFQINVNNLNSFEVLKIRTKRQIGLIDLVAEIDYKIDNQFFSCVLSIENKWYSGIRDQQLEKSAKFIRDVYSDRTIIDAVLFCDDEKISSDVISHCQFNKYKFLTINDLKHFSGISFERPSGNDLFDEYWLNF